MYPAAQAPRKFSRRACSDPDVKALWPANHVYPAAQAPGNSTARICERPMRAQQHRHPEIQPHGFERAPVWIRFWVRFGACGPRQGRSGSNPAHPVQFLPNGRVVVANFTPRQGRRTTTEHGPAHPVQFLTHGRAGFENFTPRQGRRNTVRRRCAGTPQGTIRKPFFLPPLEPCLCLSTAVRE